MLHAPSFIPSLCSYSNCLIFILLFTFYLFCVSPSPLLFFFFFNDTATTEIYTLSLHDALPISSPRSCPSHRSARTAPRPAPPRRRRREIRRASPRSP